MVSGFAAGAGEMASFAAGSVLPGFLDKSSAAFDPWEVSGTASVGVVSWVAICTGNMAVCACCACSEGGRLGHSIAADRDAPVNEAGNTAWRPVPGGPTFLVPAGEGGFSG